MDPRRCPAMMNQRYWQTGRRRYLGGVRPKGGAGNTRHAPGPASKQPPRACFPRKDGGFPQNRGRSGRSSRIWANRSSHHPSRQPGARPPSGVSPCRLMTIATSCKRHPTNCPQSISTASERYRTQAVEAPGTANWDAVCADARKPPPQGGTRRFGEPSPDGRHAQFRCSRAVRQPEEHCRSAIDRTILSLASGGGATAWPPRRSTPS